MARVAFRGLRFAPGATLVSLIALLANCSGDSSRLLGPSGSPSIAPASASKAGSDVGSDKDGERGDWVKGRVVIHYLFGVEIRDEYNFHAERPKGKSGFLGRFTYRSEYLGLVVEVRGKVVCAKVTGNRARVGGVITSSNFPEAFPAGNELTWSVTDSGEKTKDGPPDSGSPLLGADAELYCQFGLPYALETPQDRGNITIWSLRTGGGGD